MERALRAIYPPHCLICGGVVDDLHGLCPTCWRDTPFISGVVCDLCGAPLPGFEADGPVKCDDCLTHARPWHQGRAALAYRDAGRRMVLAFKLSDRTDLAVPAAQWMARAGAPLLEGNPLLVPIPLHWTRLLRRRFNQAALLAREIAHLKGLDHCPDLLVRRRATGSQKGRSVDARFQNLEDALALHPKRAALLPGRAVVLIDDVMTSGATLAAATEVCRAGGATDMRILTLARATKED